MLTNWSRWKHQVRHQIPNHLDLWWSRRRKKSKNSRQALVALGNGCVLWFVCTLPVSDKFQKEALQNDHSIHSVPISLGHPNTAVSDPQENSFWTTPGARRTLQLKNDLLVHEHVGLEDVTSSFSSPVVHLKTSEPLTVPIDSLFEQEKGLTNTIPEDFSALEDALDRTTGAHDTSSERTGQVDHQTTNVKHHPTQPLPRPVPPPTSEPNTPVVHTEQVTSTSTVENLGNTHSAKKVRITTEVERIVVCDDERTSILWSLTANYSQKFGQLWAM